MGLKFSQLFSFSIYLLLLFDVCLCANFFKVDICRETPANNAKPYCSCQEEVISCDFSSFKSEEEYEFELNGWGDNMNTNVKRLCFCGGPRKLHLMFSPNILNGLRHLHRVDLYNISGVVHTRKAFAEYFSGDLYISKVRINTLHPLSFAAGGALTIEDVSDLECCSKIKPALKHVNHPVFYMEDSKIGEVSTNGIQGDHMWKTFIWRNVSANIVAHGIVLGTPGINVSFTGCTFNRTEEYSIGIKRAANVLMAANTFTNNSHFYAFDSRSSSPNSNLILLGNFFNNRVILDVDANNVLAMFNHFDLWDNDTFYHMNHTKFTDRKYLMSLNSIEKVHHFYERAIPAGPPAEIRFFYENVMGRCDCEESTVKFPSILTDSRCEYKGSSKEMCNPTIAKAVQTCHSRGDVFRADCNYEDTPLSKVPWDYWKLLKDFLHKHGSDLNSPFIEEMLRLSPSHYEVPEVGEHEPRLDGRSSSLSMKMTQRVSSFDRFLILLFMLPLVQVIAA